MKTRSKWWHDLASACWAKVNTDSDDRPRIPTREQVLADLDAEYMAAARLDYRAHFERTAILVYPHLDTDLSGTVGDDETPLQAEIEGLPAASGVEEVADKVDLDSVNAIWLAARDVSSEPLIHPIAPLISAWQSRTVPEPRKTGIYPSSFSVARTSVFPLWADIDVQGVRPLFPKLCQLPPICRVYSHLSPN